MPPPPPGDSSGAAAFATPARRRLARATRELVDAVLTAGGDDQAALDAAARDAERAVESLTATRAPMRLPERRHHDYLPRSPLVGDVHPMAAPLRFRFVDGRVRVEGAFGAAYEGPPGYVHGGWVALAFDEVLGFANVARGLSGMTGRLTVRYRRPTPLHTELRFEAGVERVDGRRITTVGWLDADGIRTAEAEGLFVTIGAERALEYFGERPVVGDPTDPLP